MSTASSIPPSPFDSRTARRYSHRRSASARDDEDREAGKPRITFVDLPSKRDRAVSEQPDDEAANARSSLTGTAAGESYTTPPTIRPRADTITAAGRYLAYLSRDDIVQVGTPATPGRTLASAQIDDRIIGSKHHSGMASPRMSKFLSGFKRFHKTYFASNTELFETLKNGQAPKTVLVGCCDSRVDPAILTDCDPGDLFVIRNVANLVAPYKPDTGFHGVSAALEFAVKALHVENIIVLGHSKCGGIDALMSGVYSQFEFIAPWMSIAQRAKEKTIKYFGDKPYDVQRRACEHASILQSLENLITYPWIRERLQAGEINMTGWYFDFEKGDLLGYNPDSLGFETLVIDDSQAADVLSGREQGIDDPEQQAGSNQEMRLAQDQSLSQDQMLALDQQQEEPRQMGEVDGIDEQGIQVAV
ncbi:carbonic anhydrase [Entophlyctis helioformis]|nr:carbonic anhydrase [Entophlyctis helioformis]